MKLYAIKTPAGLIKHSVGRRPVGAWLVALDSCREPWASEWQGVSTRALIKRAQRRYWRLVEVDVVEVEK